jgi:uncharacterized protein YjbJ (UPF0337 family)
MNVNRDIVEGKLKQLGGKIKEQWGKLTDDEVARAQGDRDQFVGLLQEKYGYTKERAKKEVDDFFSTHM